MVSAGERVTFEPASPDAAGAVMAWALSSSFSRRWVDTSRDAEANLAEWASLDGAVSYLLRVHGVPVAYGEVWLDGQGSEAEVAHIVVDPAHRGEGWGRELTLRLAEYASSLATDLVLRVDPENIHAQHVYRRCGFQPMSVDDQKLFNAGQPHEYLWMRRE
ncbi:GNAT family N-acetyltransferase [Calidifontibacter indicus]|uniref:GNAT family N-acetyltransferase n=1 Tax=Calidifontibacter indicus TaxID=419650 RepID=UPI003D71F523